MITKLTIRSFKSLESVEVALGHVNVFVGANGSGKSNLLEALGVLSAAAAGRVDDEALMRRGVRPGLPNLYKSAFPGRQPLHIFFGAENDKSLYEVSLFNPSSDPRPTWRYHTENWKCDGEAIVGRSHRMEPKPNPEAGLAALRAVERKPGDPALALLDLLRDYAIYEPNTPTMRGIAPESQPREPVGLSGGGLPGAVLALLRAGRDNDKRVGAGPASAMLFSPSAATSRHVIRFVDRFMAEGRNVLSGTDASEGALYVLFAAVLALDERAPGLLAIDDADHGLNPRLARRLVKQLCDWLLSSPKPRQMLLTTHNPLVLDGLPLQDDRVRLFTVARTSTGRTVVSRVVIDDSLLAKAKQEGALSRLWLMGHLGGVPNV